MFRRKEPDPEEQKQEYFEDLAEKQAIEDATEKPNGSNPQNLVEDQIGLLVETIRPDSTKKWENLSKDVVLSNLTTQDISLIHEHWDLARELDNFGEPELGGDHRQMAAEILLTSQGRGGFRSKLLSQPDRNVNINRNVNRGKGWKK